MYSCAVTAHCIACIYLLLYRISTAFLPPMGPLPDLILFITTHIHGGSVASFPGVITLCLLLLPICMLPCVPGYLPYSSLIPPHALCIITMYTVILTFSVGSSPFVLYLPSCSSSLLYIYVLLRAFAFLPFIWFLYPVPAGRFPRRLFYSIPTPFCFPSTFYPLNSALYYYLLPPPTTIPYPSIHYSYLTVPCGSGGSLFIPLP